MEYIESVRLRDLTEGDLEFIIAVTKENMAPLIKDAWGLDWGRDFEERYTKELLSSGVVKVVYSSNELIGYFWFSEQADKSQVFINSIQLRKNYQKKGLGLCILKWIEQNAMNHKIQYLCLAVQEINPRAVKIYQRFGFREVLRENGSIKMRKELGSRSRMDKPL